MIIPTNQLPSGKQYEFGSIEVNPLKFGEILDYRNAAPKDDKIEMLYFDYCLMLKEDPNIRQLLMPDFYYVVFLKKALTISKNMEFTKILTCPECGERVEIDFHLSDIKFKKVQDEVINGCTINIFGGQYQIRIPTIGQFIKILEKYRKYKTVTNEQIIKMISVFKDSDIYMQKIENLVVNATYEDVYMLMVIENEYLRCVEPLNAECINCKEQFYISKRSVLAELNETLETERMTEKPSEEKIKFLEDKLSLVQEQKYGGIEVDLESLASDFFLEMLRNNQPTGPQIILGQEDETE